MDANQFQDVFLLGLYILVLAVFTFIFWSFHKDKTSFDARTIFVDSKTNRVSILKTAQGVSLITSTWILFYLTINNSLSSEIFGLYMGIWGASKFGDSWLKSRGKDYDIEYRTTNKED